MNEVIKVKCPAKINLTLEVVNKREDGFHNIKSIMQMISLYDYLTISLKEAESLKINLSGTSDEIPYDERNLVYKAVVLFLDEVKTSPFAINIYINLLILNSIIVTLIHLLLPLLVLLLYLYKYILFVKLLVLHLLVYYHHVLLIQRGDK